MRHRQRDLSEKGNRVRIVRLLVARCEVRYTGRLAAVLPEAVRLLMLKADGSVLVHADAGGYKPLNWMTPPTVIEERGDVLVVRKRGKTEDRLEIRLVEVLSDVAHDMGEAAALEKDGVERDLQEQLAAGRRRSARGCRLVRREWPTEIGPVDLMCQGRGRRVGRGRDQARRDDRGGRAADALPRRSSASTPRRPAAAACSRRSRSSRGEQRSPRREASAASRSTSRSCAASASPS